MMLTDDAIVPIPCPECCKKIEKTVGWLKSNEHVICDCGSRINVDANKVIAGLEKVERLLHATFKKLP
jgi:prophage tail gpP-like protein